MAKDVGQGSTAAYHSRSGARWQADREAPLDKPFRERAVGRHSRRMTGHRLPHPHQSSMSAGMTIGVAIHLLLLSLLAKTADRDQTDFRQERVIVPARVPQQ